MSGIWWTTKPFSKKMKAYEKRKDQKFLDARDGVVPIDIEFKDEEKQKENGSQSEHIQLFPCAVGEDQSFKDIPEAKKSPLAETDDEDEDYDDSNDDESEGVVMIDKDQSCHGHSRIQNFLPVA
jgi:hypothetical protein